MAVSIWLRAYPPKALSGSLSIRDPIDTAELNTWYCDIEDGSVTDQVLGRYATHPEMPLPAADDGEPGVDIGDDGDDQLNAIAQSFSRIPMSRRSDLPHIARSLLDTTVRTWTVRLDLPVSIGHSQSMVGAGI